MTFSANSLQTLVLNPQNVTDYNIPNLCTSKKNTGLGKALGLKPKLSIQPIYGALARRLGQMLGY